MDLELKDRVALVTGGSRGIGAAIVNALTREGCRVTFTHFDDAEHAANVPGHAIEADVADFAAAERVVAEVRPSILVCNAGITADHVIWKMSEDEWDRVLDVNLKGCFNYCRATAPLLRTRDDGRIVTITSINGLRGKFGQVNYAAAKGGLIALTKSVARELGRSGATVNAIAPGMVRTDMVRDLPKEFVAAAEEESVLGRISEPDDIADLVVFLCSARARQITGQVIQVDAGQHM